MIVANWKMNGLVARVPEFVDALTRAVPPPGERPDIAIAPPFTLLAPMGAKLKGTGILLAAQNLHPATHGAFTGEVSGPMLADLDVRYVIVGHSERRRLFSETDAVVARKVLAARESGLVPILCVGEEESERMQGRTLEVIERQLREGLSGLSKVGEGDLVVAYEPVWAIGTGRTATPAQVQEAHGHLREGLGRIAGPGTAAAILILYGGSATAETVPALVDLPDVDGGLVGGASLDPASLALLVGLVRIARSAR